MLECQLLRNCTQHIVWYLIHISDRNTETTFLYSLVVFGIIRLCDCMNTIRVFYVVVVFRCLVCLSNAEHRQRLLMINIAYVAHVYVINGKVPCYYHFKRSNFLSSVVYCCCHCFCLVVYLYSFISKYYANFIVVSDGPSHCIVSYIMYRLTLSGAIF